MNIKAVISVFSSVLLYWWIVPSCLRQIHRTHAIHQSVHNQQSVEA